MFDHWTESARRVVFFARYEAGTRGAKWIGTDHLMLGLIRELDDAGESTALPLVPESTRHKVRYLLESRQVSAPPVAPTEDMPLSHDAKCALVGADKLRREHGHTLVQPIHVLFALFDYGSYRAELETAGADLEVLRERLKSGG